MLTKTFSDLHHSLRESLPNFASSHFYFHKSYLQKKSLAHLILSQGLLHKEPKWHRLYMTYFFFFWAASISGFYLYYYLLQPQIQTINTGRNLTDGCITKSLAIKRQGYISGPTTHWLSSFDKSHDLSEEQFPKVRTEAWKTMISKISPKTLSPFMFCPV